MPAVPASIPDPTDYGLLRTDPLSVIYPPSRLCPLLSNVSFLPTFNYTHFKINKTSLSTSRDFPNFSVLQLRFSAFAISHSHLPPNFTFKRKEITAREKLLKILKDIFKTLSKLSLALDLQESFGNIQVLTCPQAVPPRVHIFHSSAVLVTTHELI